MVVDVTDHQPRNRQQQHQPVVSAFANIGEEVETLEEDQRADAGQHTGEGSQDQPTEDTDDVAGLRRHRSVSESDQRVRLPRARPTAPTGHD